MCWLLDFVSGLKPPECDRVAEKEFALAIE